MKNKYIWLMVIIGAIFIIVIAGYVMFSYSNIGKSPVVKNSYKDINMSDKELATKYATSVLIDITNIDKDKIYKNTNKGFLKLNGLKDKDELYNYLVEKKLDNIMDIIIDSYNYYEYNNKKIYTISLKNLKGEKLTPITIIESSPRNYEVAYNYFVDYISESKIVESKYTTLNIKGIEIYSNRVVYNVEIQNKTQNDINIKLKNTMNNVRVNFKDSVKYTAFNPLLKENNILKPKEKLYTDFEFFILCDKLGEINSMSLDNILVDGNPVEETYKLK